MDSKSGVMGPLFNRKAFSTVCKSFVETGCEWSQV